MRTSVSWPRLVRLARWHRRGLAACAAALAVFAALTVLAPPGPETTPVAVAARDLPAGHRLAEGDLRLADYPRGLAPRRSVDSLAGVAGEVLAGPLDAGSPVAAGSLVSRGLAPGAGELLVPFHVEDAAMLELVHVGDRITLVANGPEGQAVTLASRVRVAALPAPPGPGGALGGSSAKGLVVVSAPRPAAEQVAAWAANQSLGIALG